MWYKKVCIAYYTSGEKFNQGMNYACKTIQLSQTTSWQTIIWIYTNNKNLYIHYAIIYHNCQ